MPAGPCTGCGFSVDSTGALHIAGVVSQAWPHAGPPNALRCDPATGVLWTQRVVPHRRHRVIMPGTPPWGPVLDGGFNVAIQSAGIGIHTVVAPSGVVVPSDPSHPIAARVQVHLGRPGIITGPGSRFGIQVFVAVAPPYGTGAPVAVGSAAVGVLSSPSALDVEFPPITSVVRDDWFVIAAGGPALSVGAGCVVNVSAVGIDPAFAYSTGPLVLDVEVAHV